MKKILLSIILLVAILPLGGCSLFTDFFAEKIVEQATDTDVNLDTNEDGGLTVETEEGEWSVGTKAEIPDDFPSDMPIIDYSEVISSSSFAGAEGEGETHSVTLVSEKSFNDTVEHYAEEMPNNGWTQTAAITVNGTDSKSYEKNENQATVLVSTENEGEVYVTLTVMTE